MIGNLKIESKSSKSSSNDYLEGKISIVEHERRMEYEGEDKQDKRTLAELDKIEAKDRKTKAEEELKKLQEEQKKKENKIIEELSNPNKLDDSELEKERRNTQRDIEESEKELLREFRDPNYLDDSKMKIEIRKEEIRQVEEEIDAHQDLSDSEAFKYDKPVMEEEGTEEFIEKPLEKVDSHSTDEVETEENIEHHNNDLEETGHSLENNIEYQEHNVREDYSSADSTEDLELQAETNVIITESTQSLETSIEHQEITFDEDEENEIIDFGQRNVDLEKHENNVEIIQESESINSEILDEHINEIEQQDELSEQQIEEINKNIDDMVNSFKNTEFNTYVGEDERELESQHLYLNEGTYQEPFIEPIQDEEVHIIEEDNDPYKIRVSSDQMMGDEEDRFKITTEITDYSDRFTGVLAKYRVDGGYDNDTSTSDSEVDYEKQIEEYTQHLIEEEEEDEEEEQDEDLSIYTSALGGYADSIIKSGLADLTFQHEYDIGAEEEYDTDYEDEENYDSYDSDIDDNLYSDSGYDDY